MKDGYLIDEPTPGKYLSADSGADLPASKFYLPDDLPPDIDLSADVIREHGRAMHSLGRLDGFWSEIDDPDTTFGLFVYKEAEQSSRVEGTQVTVSGMYRKGADSKDVREARNYVAALQEATSQLVAEGRSRKNLSIDLLKFLDESLMESGQTDNEDPRPGEFREQYVWIEENTDALGQQVRFATETGHGDEEDGQLRSVHAIERTIPRPNRRRNFALSTRNYSSVFGRKRPRRKTTHRTDAGFVRYSRASPLLPQFVHPS